MRDYNPMDHWQTIAMSTSVTLIVLGAFIFVFFNLITGPCDPRGKTDDGHIVYGMSCDPIPAKK
jgi:hypothetical protein